MGMALRKLRAFTREGVADELDLDETIDATARNAGELEVVLRPPRRPPERIVGWYSWDFSGNNHNLRGLALAKRRGP